MQSQFPRIAKVSFLFSFFSLSLFASTSKEPFCIPRMPVPARGVLSPSSTFELASAMRTSGVSAPRLPRIGDDWKNIGDEDGTLPSAAKRPAARGVAWCVGLLGGSRARDDAGDAVEFLEGRPLRLDAGEDIADGMYEGEWRR